MYDVGTFVDRYQVERVIGNDAVAVVYLVRHTMLGSRHALKLLTRNSQAADKALQGARDQATLHHPHVVAITDILHVASRVGLVMELVEGGSLEAHLAKERPSIDDALHIYRGIVRGVRHAHESHILHGGLAMRRVLLDRTNGRLLPKVTAFGVEGGAIPAWPDALDDVSRIAGLPPRLDVDADLTQLGAMLYELLTGRRPSAGSHPDPRTLVPAIPEEVAQLATGLMHGAQGSFASCQEILEQLDAVLDDESAPTRPVARRAPAPMGATLMPEPGEIEAHLASSDGEDDDTVTDAPADPGASSSMGAVASVAMAGEGVSRPPTMPILDDEEEEEDESSPVPLRAIPEDRSLPPDDSIPPIDRPASRRPTKWLYGAALLLAPLLGLLAAYQMRAPVPEEATSPVVVVPEEPVAEAPVTVNVEPTLAEPPVAEATPAVEDAAPADPPPVKATAEPPPAKASATPAPAKAAAVPQPNGSIRLEGDASQFWIELAGGWVSPGGSVPPGTYKVKALFDGPEPVRAGSVTVKPATETVLRCSAAETRCQ
jgi:hypothetical protein